MNSKQAFFDILENQVYNFILNASYAGDQNWYCRAFNLVKESCMAMDVNINATMVEMIIDDAYKRTLTTK